MAELLEDYSLVKKTQKKGTIQKIGLVGCGDVGQEICRLAAQCGLDVIFVDISEQKVKEAFEHLNLQINDEINHWGLTESDKRAILSRIKGTTNYNDLKDCNIVHESVNTGSLVSNLELCREVFRKIESAVQDDAIIASNSSSLTISELSNTLDHPERAIGMHFLRPLTKVKVVEISRGINTNIKTLETINRYSKMIGKDVISLNESPGHISTRLIVTLINEACELLMEGVGTVDSIDSMMKQGFGMQFGPFEMADRMGLDKVMKWMNNLYSEYSLQKFKASPIIKRFVRNKYLGKITGKGFYKYENGQITGSISTEFKY